MNLIAAAERGLVPAPVVRLGIRRLLRARLRAERRRHAERDGALVRWIEELRRSPVAPAPALANQQHYEVPARFFELILGPRLKYSCALWPEGVETLASAEAAMLGLTAERAQLADGQDILELGCGWGSLALWNAERLPHARIVAVSNSAAQRAFIERRAAERGLENLEVVTADMNAFSPGARRFDRIVSVEMFEHMRNWPELLRRVHGWLRPGGELFVHVFTNRTYAYPFEVDGDADWMARHFFTGGMMPSDDLLPRVAAPFHVDAHWTIPGSHYARTAGAWYARLVGRRAEVLAALAAGGAGVDVRVQYHRWRLFLLACAEQFGWAEGAEWLVSHYRLVARP